MPYLHCIALRTVRTTDRTSILTAWSLESGRVSIAVPAGDSREARRRRALTMPLSLFEGVAPEGRAREIITLRDVKPSRVSVSIASNPMKGSVAMFIADVLAHVLRDSQRDDVMWQFLTDSVGVLDGLTNATALANFHIYFLVSLSQLLGIQPDVSTYRAGCVFDLQEGRFAPTAPLHRHYLEGERATMAAKVLRMHPRNLHVWRIGRRTRGEILDEILHYYTLHHSRLDELPSLSILRAMSE